MKNGKLFLLGLLALAALALGACSGGGGNSDAILTEAAQIAAQALTQTAAAAPPTATPTEAPPTPTNTPLPPTFTPTITGTLPTSTPKPTQQQSSGGGGNNPGCLRAELTFENPKDGAEILIGKTFTKTWVFKNIGTCTWTTGFTVAFIEGDLMNADAAVSFADFTDKEIQPGDHVTVEVNMVAPSKCDTRCPYQGYWMLRSDNGVYFGLGPDGKSWFWVQIYAKH